MTLNQLSFVDLETTGLDSRIHQAWEICIWRDDLDHPMTFALPHTLQHADAKATLVGANPAFDQAFLTELIGTPVWHYRVVDVCTGAMWILGWDRPQSLIDTAKYLRDVEGYVIHEADHTAEGDARAVRDVYNALRHIERVVLP